MGNNDKSVPTTEATKDEYVDGLHNETLIIMKDEDVSMRSVYKAKV